MSKQTDIARAQFLAAENNIKLFKGKGEFFPDRNENDVADWKELEVNRQEEILKQYQIAADPNNGFWKRAKSFFAATSKAGRYAKAAKDFALMFTPYGNQIDTVTDFVTERFIKPQSKPIDFITDEIGDLIKSKRTSNIMETTKEKILRIIKQPSTKAALTGIITVVGLFFSLDVDPAAVAETLTNSAKGIVLGLVGVYASYRTIRNLFTDDEKELNKAA